MTYPKSKIEIVQTILAEGRVNADFPWNNREPDKLVFEWFVTGRIGEGLRLTDTGMKAFECANIAYYKFNILHSKLPRLTSKTWENYIMLMNKKIHCPYYIGTTLDEEGKKKLPYVRIYDHKIAMLMTLYGTIDEYMESVK